MHSFICKLSLVLVLATVNIASTATARTPVSGGSVHIAIVLSHDSGPYQLTAKGFERFLHARLPGASFTRYRLQGDNDKATLQRIKQEGATLIFTLGSLATKLTLESEQKTPIIAGLVIDLKQLKRSANATGVGLEFPVETELRWLQRLLPRHKEVYVLFNPAQNQAKINAASVVAGKLGLRLHAQAIKNPRELPGALKGIANRADVLWGLADKVVLSPQTAKPVLLFSYRNRIPFTGLSGPWVKAGALYSLDRDYDDVGQQCAELAWAVLRGTPVKTLPPVPPRKVVYSLNLKTAQHMKIDLPAPLIRGARNVVK